MTTPSSWGPAGQYPPDPSHAARYPQNQPYPPVPPGQAYPAAAQYPTGTPYGTGQPNPAGQPYPPPYGGDIPPTGGIPPMQQQPMPGQLPLDPPKKPRPKWLRPVLAVVALLLIAGVAWYLQRDDVKNATVGDCVNVESEADFSITECSGDDAEFSVIAVEDGSVGTCLGPDVDLTLYQSGTSGKSWCLMARSDVGDCYSAENGDQIDCATATSSDVKVNAVLPSTLDESGCPPESTRYRAYRSLVMVVCFVPAG